MPSTYNDLYLDTRRALKRIGVESAALEAREIVCCAANKSKEEFLRDCRLYASPEIEERAAALLERRLQGEPVAYLVGEWEFYGLPLTITRDVLIPRDDTCVLADQAIAYLKGLERPARVLDLCTGSGCVGLAIASQAPDCRVVLADVSEAALRVARTNARLNHLQSRVAILSADARETPPANFDNFHCIVSNPPYIPTEVIEGLEPEVRDHEPRMALDGDEDGLKFYRILAAEAGGFLNPGGAIYLEIGWDQGAKVEELLRQAGFQEIRTVKDLAGKDRVVRAGWP